MLKFFRLLDIFFLFAGYVLYTSFLTKKHNKNQKNNPKTASSSLFHTFLYALIMYQRLYPRLTSIDI